MSLNVNFLNWSLFIVAEYLVHTKMMHRPNQSEVKTFFCFFLLSIFPIDIIYFAI